MKVMNKFFIFCIVGGLSVLVDLIVFNVLFYLSVPFIFARIFSIISALFFNFSVNRKYTFKAGGYSIRKQMPKYIIIYSVSNLVNLLVSILVINILGESVLNANIASIVGILSNIPISFLGSLLWAFKVDE